MAIRSRVLSFGYTTIIYGISNVLIRIASIALIPIYTSYLSVTDVGLIVIFEMIEILLIAIIPFGAYNAMYRYLPGTKEAKKNKIISSTFYIILINGGIIISICFFFSDRIQALFNINDNNLLFYVLLGCFLKSSSSFIYSILLYQRKAFLYLIISGLEFLSIMVFTIYFIIGCQEGIIGVYYSKSIVFSIIFLLTIFLLIKSITTFPSYNSIKRILSYGIPLIPMALLMPILSFSDRFFLNLFTSVEDIARYGIAYKFGMIINMLLIIPIQKSWGPQMFQVGIKDKKSISVHEDITFYYSFIGLFIFLGLSLFSTELINLFANKDYVSSAWIVPFVSFAYFIGGFKVFLRAGPALTDRTNLFAKIGLITIITNIILNYFLIKIFYVIGAIISTILSFSLLVCLMFFVSKDLINVNWPVKKIFHGLILTMILLIFFHVSVMYINDYKIYIKLILLCFFIAISLATNLIGQKELNGLKYLWDSLNGKSPS